MSLPSGAIRLNWIQSTGTQYVDTEFKPNQDTRVVFDMLATAAVGWPFACRKSASAEMFGVMINDGSGFRHCFGANTATLSTATTVRSKLDQNKNILTFSEVTSTIAEQDFSCTYSLFLFNLNNAGGAGTGFQGRCYFCQIYDNGALVRDFIPVKLSDGSVGLWDDVNSKFYGNAGTGTFVAGPAAEIVELEYIESTGTQHVDTEVIPNQGTRVVMDFETLKTGTYFYFGSRESGTLQFVFLQLSGTVVRSDYGTNQKQLSVASTLGRSIIGKNKEVASFGSKSVTNTASTFEGKYPIALFSVNDAGSVSSSKVTGRLYSCQIYDNGLLVRDFIPAKTIEGEVGLYDRVFHEFYRNAGTGTFIAGPEMVHKGYTELEYIESDNTQYVDTQFVPNQNSRIFMDYAVVSTNGSNTYFAGVRKAWADSMFYFGVMTTPALRCNFGADYVDLTVSNLLDRHTLDCDKGSITLDGSVVASLNGGTFTCPASCLLGAAWDGSSVMNKPSKMRHYAYQLYDNSVEVRIYIPMLHPSGVAGLWDAVNERFYASATTTDLIAGPEAVKAPGAPANFRVVSETDSTVTLAWDADKKALGYRIYQNGTQLANQTETTITADTEVFNGYAFSVLAYNDTGESKAASLAYVYLPENPMLYLITDRTRADVTAQTAKGMYQNVDLNRVGAAMNYVARTLREHGCTPDINPKVDWADVDWLDPTSAQRYLGDLAELRAQITVLKTTPYAPADLVKLTHTEANHIEQILLDVYWLVTHLYAAYRHCGVTICGQGGLIL